MTRRSKIIFFVAISALFYNLYMNGFGIIPETWFENWQKDSEQLVLNSLEKTRVNGFWYNYGLLGDYHQQVGLQGIFLRFIDSATALPDINSAFFSAIFTSIFSILICFLIYWSWKEFGVCSGVLVYFSFFFNRWLIVSVRNLYWASFTFLLPFCCMLFLCRSEEKRGQIKLKYFFIVPYFTLFIKAACGFEMISTVMVSIEIPVFYYVIKNKHSFTFLKQHFFITAFGAILAFVTSVFLNLIQQAFLLSSYKNAFDNIIYTVSKRTGFFDVKVGDIYQESLNASQFDVVYKYLVTGEPLLGSLHMISIISVLMILSIQIWKKPVYNQPKLRALCVYSDCEIPLARSFRASLTEGESHPHGN